MVYGNRETTRGNETSEWRKLETRGDQQEWPLGLLGKHFNVTKTNSKLRVKKKKKNTKEVNFINVPSILQKSPKANE